MPDLPETEKPETKPKARFVRQLVLLEVVRSGQATCEHTLSLLNQTTIICGDCGALWIK
jgi:hypothetical protein